MRSISAASLAKLSQKTGTEPVCIVQVEWAAGVPKMYADKSVPGVPELDGRIIQISAFDDILNVSGSGTSQTITVTLDDTDGELKFIFDRVDMHKKLVRIYQWFTGIPLADKFLLFAGLIASPVEWKEGDRTLTFSVISKTSDVEVGFSPEEGEFTNLPEGAVGQTWPIVFGRVAKLPCIRVDEVPYKDGTGDLAESMTLDDHGIEDPSIEPHTRDQDKQHAYALQLAQAYFVGYLQASYTARRLGELGDLDDIDKGKGTYSGLAKQYLSQGNKSLLEAQKINRKNSSLKQTLRKQKSYNKSKIAVSNGDMFKQATPTKVRIGDVVYSGQFIGDEFQISEAQHPTQEQYEEVPDIEPDSGDPPVYLARNNFFWNPAGQMLRLAVPGGDETEDPDDIRYIVACTIQVTVSVVYAWRTVDGQKRLSIVPTNYYEVRNTSFGSLPVTMLVVPNALSSLTDSNGKSLGWEDDLWATCTSTVGPNTVTIIQWIITTFTTHNVDATSFDAVRLLVAAYPSHFALRSRTDAISLVQDIAYQARCVLYLRNNVFHIKYMPRKTTAVATITEADVIEQSLQVSYTETEDIVTKSTSIWRPDYKKESPNKVVLRYNIRYYGLQEEQRDYFIYNMQQLVEKSAIFWLVRKANTFKRVTLTVPIKFLNIETLDYVTLNFSNGYVANGAVDCLVESATLDTGDYTIQLTLWVPVRAGEMTEYLFAHPGNLTVQYYFPTERDVQDGRAGGRDPASPPVTEPTTGEAKIDKPMKGDRGNGGQLHVTKRPLTYGTDPLYYGDDTPSNTAPAITSRVDTTRVPSASSGEKPDGTTTYQLQKAVVKEEPFSIPVFTTTYPAKVVSGSGEGPYELLAYLQGTDNAGSRVAEAWQLQIDEDESIPEGSWVLANRVVYQNSSNQMIVEWYIQVPVWL
jgi:hypothetical protein